MTRVDPIFLAFSVLKIFFFRSFWVTGDPLVDKGSKENILDMIGRGSIFFNVSGFPSS